MSNPEWGNPSSGDFSRIAKAIDRLGDKLTENKQLQARVNELEALVDTLQLEVTSLNMQSAEIREALVVVMNNIESSDEGLPISAEVYERARTALGLPN